MSRIVRLYTMQGELIITVASELLLLSRPSVVSAPSDECKPTTHKYPTEQWGNKFTLLLQKVQRLHLPYSQVFSMPRNYYNYDETSKGVNSPVVSLSYEDKEKEEVIEELNSRLEEGQHLMKKQAEELGMLIDENKIIKDQEINALRYELEQAREEVEEKEERIKELTSELEDARN